ncbi:MAG: glycosyltransferase family 4 protein [Thermoanaerobaculia bacterium]
MSSPARPSPDACLPEGRRSLRLLIAYETLAPDYAGGIESRNAELARALAARGHRVTLAGFGRSENPPAPGVERRSLGEPRSLYNRSGRRSLRRALEFAHRIARVDLSAYDVVETANMPFTHLARLARRCRRERVPLLVVWYEVWGDYWPRYVGRALAPLYAAIERRSARIGDRSAAISDLVRSRLQALRLRDRVALAPCGVDLAAVHEAARSASTGPPLVAAGRLIAHKRLDLLLAAVARLPDLFPGAPLLAIFGDGPERDRLGELAARLGVGDRIVFRGQVPTLNEIWRGFAGARIAVHPSEREGFGLVPLEAMAAGLPVVYCRSGESAVAELVRDGIEGCEVEPDAGALAAGLRSLLTDEDRRQQLAAGARRRAEAYSWETVAESYEALLDGMIAERAGE